MRCSPLYRPKRLGAWLAAAELAFGDCERWLGDCKNMVGTVWSVGSLSGWSRGGRVSHGCDSTSCTARRRAGSRRSRAVMRWRARELTHSGTLNSPHLILANSDDVSESWNGYLGRESAGVRLWGIKLPSLVFLVSSLQNINKIFHTPTRKDPQIFTTNPTHSSTSPYPSPVLRESSPADEHGVEHDAEAPHVGGATRVRGRREDLRRDVGGAAVLVLQPVLVAHQDAVL